MRCAVPEEKGKLLVPDDNRPALEDVSKLAAKNLAFLVELGAGFASLTTLRISWLWLVRRFIATSAHRG